MTDCSNCIHFEETTDYTHGHKISDGFNCGFFKIWVDWFDMPIDCEFFNGDE